LTHTSITAKVNIEVRFGDIMKHAFLSTLFLSLPVFCLGFGPSSVPVSGDWGGILSWVLFALLVMIAFVVLGKFTKKAIRRHRSKK